MFKGVCSSLQSHGRWIGSWLLQLTSSLEVADLLIVLTGVRVGSRFPLKAKASAHASLCCKYKEVWLELRICVTSCLSWAAAVGG